MDTPVSVKGVLVLDGKVVLVKNPRDEWELPGGRPDADEVHTAALAREFLEELSVTIAVGRMIDSYMFEVIPGRRVQIVTYGCSLRGAYAPSISSQHVAHCLCPIERLSEINLPVGYRRSVERWANAA